MNKIDQSVEEKNLEVLSKHAKTFHLASLFLPPEVAKDAASLYRFAREIDDIVDEQELSKAKKDIELLREDWATKDSTKYSFIEDFSKTCSRLNIPSLYVEELIDGVTWDTEHSVIENEEDFYIYCYQVAGVVGLMMSFVLRVHDPRAYAHATDLGFAMQMTNICRDVLEDAQRERMYLPLSKMDGVLLNVKNIQSSAFKKLISENVTQILHQAERHYASADRGLCYIPWRARFAILVAAKLYRAIGLKILREPYRVTRERVYVGKIEKFFWLVYCVFYFFHPRVWHKKSISVLSPETHSLPEHIVSRML